jgi:hypothetical protein
LYSVIVNYNTSDLPLVLDQRLLAPGNTRARSLRRMKT